MNSSPRTTLVVTGTLRLPNGSYGQGSVWVSGETTDRVTSGSPRSQAELDGARHIDVGDAYVLPGAIDAHVHCYSHEGEGMLAATRSAAAGGVTTIVEMPFDRTGPVRDADLVNRSPVKRSPTSPSWARSGRAAGGERLNRPLSQRAASTRSDHPAWPIHAASA